MTDLEIFAKQTIDQGGQWWQLEPGLYKSQNWHMVNGRNSYGDVPVYQVFDSSGKRLFASTNYMSAVEVWEKVGQK